MRNNLCVLAALTLTIPTLVGGCSSQSGSEAGASEAPSASLYRTLDPIKLPDGGWDYAAFDPALQRLFLARNDSVTEVDLANSSARKFADASGGHGVLVLQNGHELLVTDGDSNTGRILDAATGKELAKLALGKEPDGTLLEPSTGLALVMNSSGGTISLIDPTSRKLVGEIQVGGELEGAAADGSGKVFVNVADANSVAEIDMSSRKVTNRFPMKGCEDPTHIAYAPLAKRLVSACSNGVAAVLELSGNVEKLIQIGAGADDALYDSTRHWILIPAGRAAKLNLLSDSTTGVTELGQVATHEGARIGALDPQTGRVYLPAADFDPPAKPGGWPVARAGTVHLIVLEPVAKAN